MYPDLRHVLQALFQTDMPSFFSLFKTFGFFVAIAFLAAAWILTRELKRKEAQGLLNPEGLPVERAKKYLTREQKKIIQSGQIAVFPHQRVGEIVILALISGIIGAKLFNAMESWDAFTKDPIGMLFSGSGLTFYGGLLTAAVTIVFYLRKHGISVVHFCDAIAPALMLAYGIGRLGCHFSGDGDWGIFNSAYYSLPDGSLKQASLQQFSSVVQNTTSYFAEHFGNIASIPHYYAPAPSAFPTWLYAMNFTHNVSNEGVAIAGCADDYCHMLPVGVFPTSLYEAAICTLLFLLLWTMRHRLKYAFHGFGLYLLLNGVERFLIEKIKVNYRYDWGFMHPAQSEIIAVLLVFTGTIILLFYKNKQNSFRNQAPALKH